MDENEFVELNAKDFCREPLSARKRASLSPIEEERIFRKTKLEAPISGRFTLEKREGIKPVQLEEKKKFSCLACNMF